MYFDLACVSYTKLFSLTPKLLKLWYIYGYPCQLNRKCQHDMVCGDVVSTLRLSPNSIFANFREKKCPCSHNNKTALIKQIYLFDTANSNDKYLKFQFKI